MPLRLQPSGIADEIVLGAGLAWRSRKGVPCRLHGRGSERPAYPRVPVGRTACKLLTGSSAAGMTREQGSGLFPALQTIVKSSHISRCPKSVPGRRKRASAPAGGDSAEPRKWVQIQIEGIV